jgi:hypothetical protein
MVKPIRIMLCALSLLGCFDNARPQTLPSYASIAQFNQYALPTGDGWVSMGQWRMGYYGIPIKATDAEVSNRVLANGALRVAVLMSIKIQSRPNANEWYQTAYVRFVDKAGCDRLAAQGAICLELPTTKYVEMMTGIAKQLDAVDKTVMERLASQDRLIADLRSEVAALRAAKSGK